MKYVLAALAAAGIALAPPASADPIDNSIANNPGLQQACVFNSAFNARHKSACAGFSVESVASNGGPTLPQNPAPPE